MVTALAIQEVLDRIVDFLWDDKPALRACATVASAWASPSRAHLWASIRVNRIPRVEALIVRAQQSDGHVGLIRELVYDAEDLPLDEDLHILSTLLPRLSDRLPHLHTLVLIHSIWGVRESGARNDTFVAAFAGITTLRLVGQPYILSAAALLALLAQFPRLRHLSMASTVVDKHTELSHLAGVPRLASLHLWDVRNAEVLTACLAHAQEPQIQHLSADFDPAVPSAFRAVWEQVGKDVTDLHVRALRPYVVVSNPDYNTVEEASCASQQSRIVQNV
jgi:hypothetical protein